MHKCPPQFRLQRTPCNATRMLWYPGSLPYALQTGRACRRAAWKWPGQSEEWMTVSYDGRFMRGSFELILRPEDVVALDWEVK